MFRLLKLWSLSGNVGFNSLFVTGRDEWWHHFLTSKIKCWRHNSVEQRWIIDWLSQARPGPIGLNLKLEIHTFQPTCESGFRFNILNTHRKTIQNIWMIFHVWWWSESNYRMRTEIYLESDCTMLRGSGYMSGSEANNPDSYKTWKSNLGKDDLRTTSGWLHSLWETKIM